MLSLTNKHIILIVVMLSVVMLSSALRAVEARKVQPHEDLRVIWLNETHM